jgi:YidC/Oxa1 family membrane protein insertase
MQKDMGDLQPKLQEIQELHKDNPERIASETMKLFKEKGGWPLKWCLTMLLQIPIFLWLFYVVRDFSNQEVTTQVYSFLEFLNVSVNNPQTMFFGIDLLVGQNLVLTLLAAGAMYAQMQLTQITKPAQAPKIPWVGWANVPDMTKMMGWMNIVFVAMMGVFVWSMPAAIWLYVITSTLFWVIHQAIQFWPVLVAKYRAMKGIPETLQP